MLRVPYPRSIVQVDSGTAALWLLHATDMLGVLPRPMLSATNACLREMPTKERFPPFTVGIFSRSESPLHRTSSALAKIVITIGKRVALRAPSSMNRAAT